MKLFGSRRRAGLGSLGRFGRGRRSSAGVLGNPLASIALSSIAAYGARRLMNRRRSKAALDESVVDAQERAAEANEPSGTPY